LFAYEDTIYCYCKEVKNKVTGIV